MNKKFLFSILYFLGFVFFEMYGAVPERPSLKYGDQVRIKNYNYLGLSGNKLARKGTAKEAGSIFQLLASVDRPNEKIGQTIKFGDYVCLKIVFPENVLAILPQMVKDAIAKGMYATLVESSLFGVTTKPEEAMKFQFSNKSNLGKEMKTNSAFCIARGDEYMTWRDSGMGDETFLSKEDTYRPYRQSFQVELAK